MQELEKRIGLLRLLLADIRGKRGHLVELDKQYRSQLAKVVEFVVYRDGDVANALSLMADVQAKLDEVTRTGEHLEMIAGKANMELDVLTLTKSVAEARSKLHELENRQKELSGRLSGFSDDEDDESKLLETALPKLEAAQRSDIRHIHDEVAAISDEISRLNNLITEASERAARTVHSVERRPAESVKREV